MTEDNIIDFLTGLDVLVDEIDQLGMKIRLRQEAKKLKLPLVMAADNGDGGILDVERHDLDDDIPYFHGRAGDDLADRVLGKNLPQPVIGRIIGEELIGYEVTDPRMQQSLLAIGQTIPTWPQLGTAAWLNGVAIASVIRRMLTDQPVVDNRANLNLNSWLDPTWDTKKQQDKRAQDTKAFAKEFNARIDEFMKRFGE